MTTESKPTTASNAKLLHTILDHLSSEQRKKDTKEVVMDCLTNGGGDIIESKMDNSNQKLAEQLRKEWQEDINDQFDKRKLQKYDARNQNLVKVGWAVISSLAITIVLGIYHFLLKDL